jgi:hypothetical protein
LASVNVIAAVILALVIAAAVTPPPKPTPQTTPVQIYCEDARQAADGYGGWMLCELKLRKA